MTDKYILDKNGEPILCNDLIEWARHFEKSSERIVKQEHIGDSKISTVFLGLDHAFSKGSPVLWETMVFGGKLDQETDRCSGTRAQAKTMHERMVEKVRANL